MLPASLTKSFHYLLQPRAPLFHYYGNINFDLTDVLQITMTPAYKVCIHSLEHISKFIFMKEKRREEGEKVRVDEVNISTRLSAVLKFKMVILICQGYLHFS